MTATQPYADWHRERECGQKVRHFNRGNARTARRRLAQAGHQRLSDFHTYLCSYCSHWHVGAAINGIVTPHTQDPS